MDNIVEENRTKASNMRFLFCFMPQQTANQCCCGCTLRVGTQILCIMYLLSNIFSFGVSISWVSAFGSMYPMYVSQLIISICQVVGPLMILISTCNNNFNLAYIGNFFYMIFTIVSFLNAIILPWTNAFYSYEVVGYIFYFIIICVAYFQARVL